ncbi:UDP-GalNAc:beta-1, 3-N-acetylgalactosaminyltransferase 2 [Araneus ventricosus]|uniref:Hexosyltransferase n=1 Tax=Araneus ventricosus TaxID=182803 RepID=A0A4Y2NP53_ARAVE|nr:UDP-GalNAc:beta-1, 3-N-acetylgalactosaminyltransferase 2 [Araneus ventricosus]
MLFYFKSVLCIFIAVILSFYHEDLSRLRNWIFSGRERTILAIGILSARENFEFRQAARSSWLQKYSSRNSDARAWFIVGNNSCEIPPEYRLNEYGCEKWKVDISGLQEKFFTANEIRTDNCSSNLEKHFYGGFSFQVNYPVVVTQLGILSPLLLQNTETKVAIMDPQSKEIIVQASVSLNKSSAVHGYLYADVDPILLPKNFEGMILVEGYLKEKSCLDMVWNDGGGIITFKRIYPTQEHLDSKIYSSEAKTALSIRFFVPEIAKLKRIVQEEELVTKQWFLHLEELNKRLRTEVAEKEDILIVNVTDTYRSLPAKLLKFYQWLYFNHDFSYILKTDDDSVINVAYLLQKLQEDSQFDSTKAWIWSQFRKNWPLNYIGKWADYEYQSPYYPTFPCGAAYVMSQKTALWLIANAELLHTYQGEDVSIGIWLSAINPNIIEDDKFECDRECNFESYNRAQLSPYEVHEVWSFFEKCQNLCSCK